MSATEKQDYKGVAIVPYGRSIISLMIARSLAKQGIKVIGCDTTTMTVLSFSNHVSTYETYTSPQRDERGFIKDIKTIIQKHQPDTDVPYLLIPVFNETSILAQHKGDIEALGITIAGPDAGCIEKIHPKDNFARTLEKSDANSPKNWLPESKEHLKEIQETITFPVLSNRLMMSADGAFQRSVLFKNCIKPLMI